MKRREFIKKAGLVRAGAMVLGGASACEDLKDLRYHEYFSMFHL